MRFFRLLAVLVLVSVLSLTAAACGSVFDQSETPSENTDTIAADNSAAGTASAQQADNGSSADSSGKGETTQAVKTQDTSPQTDSEPITVTEEDKEAKIDKFIGKWLDTSDPSRFCVIKKTEIGYSYTDNESNFPAEVKDGVLMIHIEVEDAYAKGKVDETTGLLTITYGDQKSTFKKE